MKNLFPYDLYIYMSDPFSLVDTDFGGTGGGGYGFLPDDLLMRGGGDP